MRTRIAVAVASVCIAAFGTAAFGQAVPPPPPQQPMPPQQQMPPQQEMPPPAQQGMQQPPQQQSAAHVSGATVAREIKSALTRNGITATKVKVKFSDGTATLTGTVFTHKDIARARSVAMHVHGVTSVDVSGLHARKA